MPSFTDKMNRLITVEVFGDDAEATFNGEIIGDVQTTGLIEVDDRTSPMQPEITGWNVKSGFRRAGIATEMVRLLCEEFGPLVPAEQHLGNGNKNALTTEGYALTVACQRLGYIRPFPKDMGFYDDSDE